MGEVDAARMLLILLLGALSSGAKVRSSSPYLSPRFEGSTGAGWSRSLAAAPGNWPTKSGVPRQEITPLLAQMSEKSEGRTLEANIALLENNARVAAAIAACRRSIN